MKILILPNFLCEVCWQPLRFDPVKPSPEVFVVTGSCGTINCERHDLRLKVPLRREEAEAVVS